MDFKNHFWQAIYVAVQIKLFLANTFQVLEHLQFAFAGKFVIFFWCEALILDYVSAFV